MTGMKAFMAGGNEEYAKLLICVMEEDGFYHADHVLLVQRKHISELPYDIHDAEAYGLEDYFNLGMQ